MSAPADLTDKHRFLSILFCRNPRNQRAGIENMQLQLYKIKMAADSDLQPFIA